MDDIFWLDATAQAALVREKKISPRELVDVAIARAEALDPKIEAIVTPMYDQAREAASGHVAEPPVPLGTFDTKDDDVTALFARATSFSPFMALANVTGQPAMTVPLHWNAAGLPIGVHFAGRYGDEGTLFRLAAQLERARPRAQRRPPLG